MQSKLKHAGIVLAAGASSRMGFPKALLELPDKTLLAEQQSHLLEAAGCEKVVVVTGRHHREIEAKLTGCTLVYNDKWESGRLSSIQAGLRSLPDFDGYLILPVDTVGVHLSTIIAVIDCASKCYRDAVRPEYDKRPGKVLWISGKLAKQMLEITLDKSYRIDELVASVERYVRVDDKCVLNNVNTQEDWRRIKG